LFIFVRKDQVLQSDKESHVPGRELVPRQEELCDLLFHRPKRENWWADERRLQATQKLDRYYSTMSSSNNEDEGGNKAIQLDTMSLDQLQQLQQREENRMQALTNRYAQLRSAAARLLSSAGAVQDLEEPPKEQDSSSTDAPAAASDDCATKDVFVPLTDSVYVPGKIRLLQPDAKDLLVELGTGYFVEKSSKETLEYIDRKLKLVDDNSANGMSMRACM